MAAVQWWCSSSLPWGGSTLDDGQCQVGPGSVGLLRGEAQGVVLHYGVSIETDVDPTVKTVRLLGYGHFGAAEERPLTRIRLLMDAFVFLVDEVEALGGKFMAVFSGDIFGDVGIKVGDGGGGQVEHQAGPVVAVSVEGHQEPSVREEGAGNGIGGPSGTTTA